MFMNIRCLERQPRCVTIIEGYSFQLFRLPDSSVNVGIIRYGSGN